MSDGKGWVGCVAAFRLTGVFNQKIALDCIEFVENKALFCKWICECSSYGDNCICIIKSLDVKRYSSNSDQVGHLFSKFFYHRSYNFHVSLLCTLPAWRGRASIL